MAHDGDVWFAEPCEEITLASDQYDFTISLLPANGAFVTRAKAPLHPFFMRTHVKMVDVKCVNRTHAHVNLGVFASMHTWRT